jgi:hypothetical protein
MNIWWLTINRAKGNSYQDLKHRRVIAQGWPHLGDLSTLVANFDAYWQHQRPQFEILIRLLAAPVYPEDADEPPKALYNLYHLLGIAAGDLIVAVESAQGAGQVMGICQPGKNAWESYRHDDPQEFDYAHAVCFPARWIDWDPSLAAPPGPPAMIAGVVPMGEERSKQVEGAWFQMFSRL